MNYQPIKTPKHLAKTMANLAKLIRDPIKNTFNNSDSNSLLKQSLELFRKLLTKDLTEAQFADILAQIICYSLFITRYNRNNNTLVWQKAILNLPQDEVILTNIFQLFSSYDLDKSIIDLVDELDNIFQTINLEKIITKDDLVYFYEIFLAAYDPKMRESKGIYYTPKPVVSYLVRSVDYLLKNKFKINQGLADEQKILILDPAVGTGTFLQSIIDYIDQHNLNKNCINQKQLPHLLGLELLIIPYFIAKINLTLHCHQLGYNASNQRLKIYLTNPLEDHKNFINSENSLMIIIGNPPYLGHSVNRGSWIKNLLKSYFEVDGKPLGEKNPKWLNDDYVKFIRFSQWRIEKTGYGILAFVTNHGYLDNPTFRGMRQSLRETFDEIYILDLHGNSKKKEVSPDGSPDQNVFDIQQGVAIGIFIKYQHSQQELATVYHADLYGVREIYENQQLVGGKYYWLAENDLSTTHWEMLKPSQPFYLFKPQNINLLEEYNQNWKITDIMRTNSIGMITSHDHFAIDFQEENILQKFRELREYDLTNQEYAAKYNIKDNRDWQLDQARKLIRSDEQWQDKIIKCLYRPFDSRYCYFSRVAMERPRQKLTNHVFRKDNLCLGLGRQGIAVNDPIWSLISVSNVPMDANLFRRGAVCVFPLYLYPTDKATLFDVISTGDTGGRKPNLSPQFITEFSQKLNLQFIPDGKGNQTKTFTPEDIFNYIYAVFYSPTYRQRYADFLKIDFPRLPLTSNTNLFWELVAKGKQLVQLHLMKETGAEISTYPIPGSNIVEQVKYQKKNQEIWINSTQYFTNVSPQIWNFYIGGYQVCQKWLKDRKGKELNYDNVVHYHNIISIITETIKIMEDIDQIINNNGGFPLG